MKDVNRTSERLRIVAAEWRDMRDSKKEVWNTIAEKANRERMSLPMTDERKEAMKQTILSRILKEVHIHKAHIKDAHYNSAGLLLFIGIIIIASACSENAKMTELGKVLPYFYDPSFY